MKTLFLALGIASLALPARADAAKHEGFSELTIDQVTFKDVKASDLPQDHERKLVFYCHNRH